MQENSEQDAIGTIGPDSLPVPAVPGAASEDRFAGMPDALGLTIERLWQASQAQNFGLSRAQFVSILLQIGEAQNWGAVEDSESPQAKAAFLDSLKLDDLVLARACAAGNEAAWEVFLTRYREVLYRAAYAIAREESAGRELADSLYADLYGLGEGGIRRSRLDSFMGRGSLGGWLRSVLAQRFVDGYRKTHREESFDEQPLECLPAASVPEPAVADSPDLPLLTRCIGTVLSAMDAEERFLLATYYLDGRALWQIAKLLAVHESTISRRLDRVTRNLRKALLRELERAGLSRRAAQEMLETDVRDIEIDLRKLLQAAQPLSFKEERVKARP
ncbi:MAG TPA: sigma-70 family RNA polymerase sigma factor [Terracidiphilus sp.]